MLYFSISRSPICIAHHKREIKALRLITLTHDDFLFSYEPRWVCPHSGEVLPFVIITAVLKQAALLGY